MDTSDESDYSDSSFSLSLEQEYEMSCRLKSLQVPTDMEACVPNFKPHGTQRRLQEVIEMVFLDKNEDEDEDEEDVGILVHDIPYFNYGRYPKDLKSKAESIAGSKQAEESFAWDKDFDKVPSTYDESDLQCIKEEDECNGNDITLPIPLAEAEFENYPVIREVKNAGKLDLVYGVVLLKKKEGLPYKINVKCESDQPKIPLERIVPPPPIKSKKKLALKCSRNAVRTPNAQITLMRDPLDSLKRNKHYTLTSIKSEL